MNTHITDEQLMAFADGLLDEPEFSAIANAVETDPDVAHRVEQLALGGRLASAVYGPLADQPVPAGLRAGVDAAIARSRGETPTVVPLRRPHRAAWLPFAAAACLGAAIVGPLGYWAGNGSSAPSGIAVGQTLTGDLLASLRTLPSGEQAALPSGQVLRPIGTFTDASGHLCREFELDGDLSTVAIACREAEEWHVAIALDAPIDPDGYAPASSLAAMDAFLGSIEASANLPPDEERLALEN
jgi:hypothetical protein